MLRFTLIFIMLITSACTSTSIIRTHPMGAKVYIDDSLVGKTPYTHTDKKWFLGQSKLRLEKEGYKSLETTLKRSQEWDIGAILGFFSLPWCRKYKSEQYFHLNK